MGTSMTWYQREIDGTVEVDEADETETDRMWRQIDPQLAHILEGARVRHEHTCE